MVLSSGPSTETPASCIFEGISAYSETLLSVTRILRPLTALIEESPLLTPINLSLELEASTLIP